MADSLDRLVDGLDRFYLKEPVCARNIATLDQYMPLEEMRLGIEDLRCVTGRFEHHLLFALR